MVSGGAERVISLLANHFANKNYDVDIALLLENKVDNDLYRLHNNISIIDLTAKKTNSYFRNSFIWIKKIREYLKKSKPDCVVSFIGRINALVLTSSRGLHIPILVSERNDPKKDGRGRLMSLYCSHIYKRAKKIVFQTEYAKSCFPKLSPEKCIIIPNPVEVDRCSSVKKDPLMIASAGRLMPVKNHKMLIEAMGIVVRAFPNVKCHIYGKGEEGNNLKEQIKESCLDEVVFLDGSKNNIGHYLSESSIFVLTSQYEGMPNALIEAMMCENACISTRYSGVEDIIENGKNGLLVDCNDSENLAKLIINLLSDNNKRSYLAQQALFSSQKYAKPVVIELWEKTIKELTLNQEQ